MVEIPSIDVMEAVVEIVTTTYDLMIDPLVEIMTTPGEVAVFGIVVTVILAIFWSNWMMTTLRAQIVDEERADGLERHEIVTGSANQSKRD